MSAVAGANRSRAQLWRDIGRLIWELWAAHPLAFLGSLALLLVGNARAGLYVTAMGGIVDALVHGSARGHPVAFWLAIYVIASALEEFHWAVYPVISTYLRDHGAYRIQQRVLERAAAAPLIQFEEETFFAHLQRAIQGMDERFIRLYGQLTGLGQMAFMLGSIAAALFVVYPALLPLLIIGAVPSLWLHVRTATAVYWAQREHTTRDRIRMHLQRLLTGREAAAEVRLFDSAGYLLGRWSRLRDQRVSDVIEAERRRALSGALGGLASGAAYAAGLVLVVYLIYRGRLSVGSYVSVATGALWFEEGLGGLIAALRSLEEDAQFLGDLFDFFRLARGEAADVGDDRPYGHGSPTRPAATHGLSSPDAAGTSERGMAVEARELAFSYPGASRPAVRSVSLHIERGEHIAIVGENGAGKTTLVKLLIGLYQPDSGSVHLDGVSPMEDPAGTIRQRIAAVFQDYAAFQLTVRENVGFGNPARMQDDRALLAAAERAGIAAMIARLPEGYDVYLGRQFGDMDISGGQWQRLALARAFFRDADLLVLDEPKAALDPLAESALFERFIDLADRRTAIMISHRLGATRLADRIIVMRDGKIVEEGRHDALVSRGGLYAALYSAQAQWYR